MLKPNKSRVIDAAVTELKGESANCCPPVGIQTDCVAVLCTRGGEVERFEGNAIWSLDGAGADPKLPGNFVTGVICNAANDEHEPAKTSGECEMSSDFLT